MAAGRRDRRFGGPRQPERRFGTRERRPRFLIVTGGVRTEHQYFEWVQREFRTAGVELHLESEGYSPRGLLEVAIKKRDQDARDARRSGDSSNTYEEVWVVTDVDEFVTELREVSTAAESRGVRVAVSNPCFEAWLVMHVDGSAAPVDRFQAQSKAKQLGLVDPNNDKIPVTSVLRGKFQIAAGRADSLIARHEGNGTVFPHDTPSTRVHLLVRRLEEKVRESKPGWSSPI